MEEKITSKILLIALRAKLPKAAVLGEVTMEDEEESHRIRTGYAKRYPAWRKSYDKKGLSYDAVLPEGYDFRKAVSIRRIDALIFEGDKKTAIEIKISRADFFRDTLEKRYAWMKHTHRFIYLTPKGLIKVEEVPDGCGLWEYENGVITSVKNARGNKNIQDFPISMYKYFVWRAFIAEQKLAKQPYKRR
jgi:hypothetical protein